MTGVAKIPVSIVVALAKNGVIGRDGGLPWKLSTDLKRFKALTIGKPVIMGRKTFDSIGRPLPGRPNIVVTRSQLPDVTGIDVVHAPDEALALGQALAARDGAEEVCIIGGGNLYAQTIGQTDILYVTHVEADVDGDTRFPEIDPAVWETVAEEAVPMGERDNFATRFATYRRHTV